MFKPFLRSVKKTHLNKLPGQFFLTLSVCDINDRNTLPRMIALQVGLMYSGTGQKEIICPSE